MKKTKRKHTPFQPSRITSVKRELLKGIALLGTCSVTISPARRLKIATEVIYGDVFNEDTRSDNLNRSLYALERDGFVKYRARTQDVVLTKKALAYMPDIRASDIEIKPALSWDGRWRMVLFDVPEHSKRARNLFRFHLKRLGFIEYQKSVFVFPHKCEKQIRELSVLCGVEKHSSFLEAVRIDGDTLLKKKFRI